MAAIASAPPVVSSATSSSEPRLFANSSSSSRRVLTRPAERTFPSSEIATSQNSRWTSKPMYLITGLLLFVADAGDQVGKRHRRIRARGTSGPVAAAATEKHGLAAHRANGLPSLRSPKEPLVPERPTLRLEPDAQLTRTQGAVSWPEKRHSAHCYSEAHEWRVPLALSSPAARQLEAGFGRPNALRRD